MLRKIIGIVLLLGVLMGQMFTLQRCANPLPPKGGPKDSIGPMMVLEESTPSFQTNFRPRQIEITFDEWVKLKDPTQIIISPPIDPQPKVSLKKKTLTIDFGETPLRDSATYVINIGEAVVDLTEGNPAENLRMVFATGPVLDSASVSGRLLNAYTKEPMENALFGLYANLADTAVRTENPFYFAKADEEGNFNISNIKPGVYRGIALDNGGQSGYKLDGRSTKSLGFPDTLLVIPDSNIVLPNLLLSELPRPLRLQSRDTSKFGVLTMTFDRSAENVLLRSANEYLRIDKGDTMRLFYEENLGDSLFFGLSLAEGSPLDTIVLLPKVTERAVFKGRLIVDKKPERTLSPLKQPAFEINRPIRSVNDSLIHLRLDTFPDLLEVTSTVDTEQVNRFLLRGASREEQKYQVVLLPGAVTDVFGKSNRDSIVANYQVVALSSLGTLTLQLRNFDPERSYILRLIKEKSETPTSVLFVNGQTTYDRTLPGLPPATYRVEIIRDENENGVFDGADYDTQRQPEPVRTFILEALRADWEVEAEIDLDVLEVLPKPKERGSRNSRGSNRSRRPRN